MKTNKVQYRRYTRSGWGNFFYFFFLTLFGLFSVLPIIYTVCTSLKPLEEILIFPPRFFVTRPTLENYTALPKLLSNLQVPLSRYIFNSFFVSVVTTVLHILIASMAAFVLAKLKFRGSKAIFMIVQFALLYNTYTLAIPQYVIFSKIHMIDTYWVYILPYLPSTLGVFLMKQFIDSSIPDALLEAGRIDGAGLFKIYRQIAFPIMKPAWLTLALFAFRDLWSMQPQGTIFSEELKMLPNVMSTISSGGIARSGSAMAATVILLIPPVILYIEDILPLITDYIDIYSFHFYAPNWPDGGAVPKNAADNNYELYAKHFNTFISEINKYDSGADYWLDEWNYSGMFIKTPYYATQLAQAVAAALNTGTQNVLLWQLFETKWPERQDTGGEFAGGIHKIGLAPPLTESQVPYDVYYGYSLLTKYMGKRNATVYHGTGDQGVYTAMIENTDGTQSILVVNTNQSAKMIHLTTGRKVNGVLLRHLYDPATVTPSARAAVISADKAFNDVSAGLTDVIPAGAVVVYTTEP